MASQLLYKLAQEIDKNKSATSEKEKNAQPIDPMAIMDFFASNYDITDDQFHSFAEQNGFNIHEAEEIAYNLASAFMQMIRGGRGYNLDANSVDPQQLKWGMIIESEHSSIPAIQKKIALDHLAEDPQYYSNDIFQKELQKEYEQQIDENQELTGEEKQAAESCKTKKIMKKKSAMIKTSAKKNLIKFLASFLAQSKKQTPRIAKENISNVQRMLEAGPGKPVSKSFGIPKKSSLNPSQVLSPKTISGLQKVVTSLKKRNITNITK